MDASVEPSSMTMSNKRSHDEANGIDPTTTHPQSPRTTTASSILTTLSSTPSRDSTVNRSRQASPAVSVTSSVPTSASNVNGANTPSGRSTKKRKLNFAEKEAERQAKQAEREAKERQKAEEKARREEEKRARDEQKRRDQEKKEEDKRKKELEKAEKQAKLNAEKDAKEMKRREEEGAKQKKEKSQLRLNNFFLKPAAAAQSPQSPEAHPESPISGGSRRGSIASIRDVIPSAAPATTKQQDQTDYQLYFLPYELPSNGTVAPGTYCQLDDDARKYRLSRIDASLHASRYTAEDDDGTDPSPLNAFRSVPFKRRRGQETRKSLRSIINSMNGSAATPIDLTDEGKEPRQDSLKEFSLKYLCFREDVRPPYHGTYTRTVSPNSGIRLSRKPFTRALPDTNYDYDSEAEWEPPQEGDEDLMSGEEDLESEDGDEDMEGFLEDDDDGGKRRMIVGDMIPVSTGLVWENETNDLTMSRFDLQNLRINTFTDDHSLPIDPYSTKYWAKPSSINDTLDQHQLVPNAVNAMQPPTRSPLGAAKPNSAVYNQGTIAPITQTAGERLLSVKSSQAGQRGRPPKDPSKSLRMVSSDLLPTFKTAVAGSNLSKQGLIEVLKKQFPKIAKDVIKDTLTAIAVREGAKEVDKIWVLLESS